MLSKKVDIALLAGAAYRMVKRRKWKAIQVPIKIGTRGFSGSDLDAFYRGDICFEELLRREKRTSEVSVPPKEREAFKSMIRGSRSGSRCMYPGCENDPVEVHMLSRASCLSVLASSGTVLKFNEDEPGGKIFLDRVPVAKVSTERCFCAQHDNDLFRVLDSPVSRGSLSAEYSFKLAYRLLCGRIPAAEKFLSVTEDYFRESGNGDPSFFDLRRYRDNQSEYIRVRELMDVALLEERWDVVESDCWEVPTGNPTVAAAGAASLEDIFQKNRNSDKTCVFVAALPEQEGKTLVVVSYMKEDSETVRRHLGRTGVLGKDGRDADVPSVLSRLLLRYCRYICISPSFFEAKSRSEWEEILEYWYETSSGPFCDLERGSGETFNLFCGLGSPSM
ncbi:MAG: hypothetical protein OXC39_08225 [Candidatus Dadabacteria bacterium]|nr:hypothetical protein [Candidatus Dadabacteria bacterium]